MRRFIFREHSLRRLCGFPCRYFGSTVDAPEAIREILAADERDQRKRELAVDTRSVVFTSAASADHRPRIAAAEAFDVAAAALPQPPNFCFMSVSLDYAGMMDAPEVVWYNLCKVNGVTPSTVKPQQLHMVGGAVRHQRPGGGYIQLLLGCIPDLESDVFTFDAIPEVEDFTESNRPPPAMCFSLLDNKLALQYERVLSGHLQVLGERLHGLPVVGGVCPPAYKTNDGNKVKSSENNDGDSVMNEMGDSVFFINDRVYTGSAAGVVLRSSLLKGHQVNVVPSISVNTVKVTSVSCTDGVYNIMTLDGRKATEVIKDVYCSSDLQGKTSKVFLGIRHDNVCIPLSFIGHPESGQLHFTTPKGVEVKNGDSIDLVVDETELDSEAAASFLIGLQQKLSVTHVTKDITVAREARKNIVASSVAAFHFSHGGMNVIARPEVNVTLGNSTVLFAPSLLQRCVGKYCPTSGFFCPGQIITLGNTTGVYARSSSYCFLEGLK
ncbi:uncharacterized protein TM35_000162710 [Trypanosoma theileri]|uniref:Uncharacterized protein n=1 Tax=Trypanosoma theileri TaxID=67003 RepID=A0A1X0NVX9_9TRYP|nr:uncharacterized protein TM35_000162710 [Trypanosoma theileri]ORC88633.1 hypothetical protein TM35_000162710 [Trypanosoma theileri]